MSGEDYKKDAEYKYGFKDADQTIVSTGKGLSEEVVREISKKHEEVYRGKIDTVLEELGEPKGEFVILIEENKEKENFDDIDIISHVDKLISQGLDEKDAIKKVAKLHGLIKNDVYIEYKEAKK